MSHRHPLRLFRSVPYELGVFAALLALVVQLSFGAFVAPNDNARSQLAVLDAANAICTSSHSAGEEDTPSHWHQPVDLAVCPLGVGLTASDVILPSLSVVAVSYPVLVTRAAITPPGRGPPPATAHVSAPRAPPLSA